MLPTIKSLVPKIEIEVRKENAKWSKDWKSKDYREQAGRYKEFFQYTELVFRDFKEVTIHLSNKFLHFTYPAGSAKLYAGDRVDMNVLLPLIEDIAFKYGNRIIND